MIYIYIHYAQIHSHPSIFTKKFANQFCESQATRPKGWNDFTSTQPNPTRRASVPKKANGRLEIAHVLQRSGLGATEGSLAEGLVDIILGEKRGWDGKEQA